MPRKVQHTDLSQENYLIEEAASGVLGTPKLGGPFSLTDHNGKSFSFPADLKGRHALIYFGFTHCPDICPEELEKISETLNLLGDDCKRLLPIFVTCDPDRDSPALIKEYLADFHPSLLGLTGDYEDVKAAAKLFRVYFKAARTSPTADYLVDHSIFYYLMDPEGRYVGHFGRDHQPADVAQAIREALK